MILLSAQGDSFFQFIVVLFIFMAVLVLTYYTTKWMAGFQKEHQRGTNLSVIETVRVGNNKYVEIVQAGIDHYIIIGIGKDEIVYLGELDSELVKNPEGEYSFQGNGKFQEILKKFTNLPNKKD
jgi:flagellar protein FliO/FliZ